MKKIACLLTSILIFCLVPAKAITHTNQSHNDSVQQISYPHLLALNLDNIVEIIDVNPEIPKEGRKPIIMIHGWSFDGKPASPGSGFWNHFKQYMLENPELLKNFKPYYVEYWSNYVSIYDIAAELRDKMEEAGLHEETVIIMAHSMGGLVARSYMNEHAFTSGLAKDQKCGNLVDRLITLGTPHHGSPMANGPARNSKLKFPQNLFTSLIELFVFKDMKYDELNRSELQWSNYDNLLDYNRFSDERNEWLVNLNRETQYNYKTICYTASIEGKYHSNPQNNEEEYELGSWIIYNGLDMINDGIVPLSSASFAGHEVYRTRHFEHYNHSDIIRGKTNKEELFEPMKTDLLEVKPIKLIWPNPEEELFVKHSQTVQIEWEAPESTAKVNLYFSFDNGQSFVPLATNIDAEAGSFSWQVPVLNSNECLMKISNAQNEFENAVSDNAFTIYKNEITLVSPSRTSYFLNYSENSIEWFHEGLESELAIYYIDELNRIDSVIAENIRSEPGLNTFSMSANTQLPATGHALIKMEITQFRNDVSDEENYSFISDPFKMLPLPEIKILSPLTFPSDYFGIEGETLIIGNSYNITLNQSGNIQHIELYLCNENKEIISLIETLNAEPCPDTTLNINWEIPFEIGNEFYFFVQAGISEDSLLISTYSENSFRINHQTNIISPADNETLLTPYPCFSLDAPPVAHKYEFELRLKNEPESLIVVYESSEPNYCVEETIENKLVKDTEYLLTAWSWINNQRTYAHQITFTVVEVESSLNHSVNNLIVTCYPNPVSSVLQIELRIDKTRHIEISLKNLSGKRLENIAQGVFTHGFHRMEWQVPKNLKPGIYLCTLKTGNIIYTERIVVN